MATPIYLIQPAGPARDTTAAALGPTVVPLDGVAALGELDGWEPGLLVVDPHAVEAVELVELAGRVWVAETGWTLALLSNGGTEVRTLSLGAASTLQETAVFAESPEEVPGALLELRGALAQISRTRHDVNNPLTSALAETQLLLLDVEDEELRESLGVIQEQLRRIRDLVAATRHLRL